MSSQPPATSSPDEPTTPRPGVIGYAGCSVTTNAVEGYAALGGTRIWPRQGLYSGGSIAKWARSIGTDMALWEDFQALLSANPNTVGIWLGLCTSGSDGTGDVAHGYATTVLDELRRLAPGATIWVSAQPMYSDHKCGISGANGPTAMAELADRLVAEGLALAGPTLGPLTFEQTIDG
ncbi:MAG: hypothetical protein R3246_10665, partial [Acidimicrobiia bacterium]|nr:hypothetical protein [Acidimicrobiia bacterium]